MSVPITSTTMLMMVKFAICTFIIHICSFNVKKWSTNTMKLIHMFSSIFDTFYIKYYTQKNLKI